MSSTKTGRLPFIARRFVQRSPRSCASGRSNRSASIGCSLFRCRMALRITAPSSAGGSVLTRDPMVPARGLRVVEVDDDSDPALRHPDAHPGAVVLGIHHVDPVAAVARLLVLEVALHGDHPGVRVARGTTDVLGPVPVAVAGPLEPVARVAVQEVVARTTGREELRVRSGHLGADPAAQRQRSDIPAAGAVAMAAAVDPAAGPCAVHEPEVVALHRTPGGRPGGRATGAARAPGAPTRPTRAPTRATGAPGAAWLASVGGGGSGRRRLRLDA